MFFQSLFNAMPGGIAQGLIWGILALGVYITYRILDFADLSVDGTFATGGCVSIVLTSLGVPPILTLIIAFCAGAVAGIFTAVLNTKLKIPAILSGILTMTALYSINKHILLNEADLSIPRDMTIGGKIAEMFGVSYTKNRNLINIGISVISISAIIGFLYWFFGTETGSSIRATGNNSVMATAQGINTDRTKTIALAISNGLAALAGSLFGQYNNGANLDMATGAVVIGLASVIIGELIFSKKLSFWLKLIGVIVGSIIYRIIFVIALRFGMDPDDLNLVSSIIVIIALSVPRIKDIIITKKSKKKVKEDAQNA